MSLVFVYRNLHRQPYWSVRGCEGEERGLVISHELEVYLVGVRFVVGERSRERVLREGVKNVHAGVKGEWRKGEIVGTAGWILVSYNPYRSGSFFCVEDGLFVSGAKEAVLKNGKEVWVRGLF